MGIYDGLSELIEQFTNLFWGVGYFGWQIATIYALYVAFDQSIEYGAIFVVMFVLFGWLNKSVFKAFINDPRPANSTAFLDSEHFEKKANGMPSGHAQQTALSLTLAYLLTQKGLYESVALFGLTVLQRYVYNNHTMLQLLVGSILGVCLGVLVFYVFQLENKIKRKLENKLEHKP